MTFQECINDYLTQLDCTARELSAASGISAPVISRYRRGTQSPEPDGEQWRKLAAGIAALAQERGLAEITQGAVETAFRDALTAREAFDKEHFCRNLNELLDAFSIGNTELARYLSYDASFLSRIRSGQRTPRDAAAFALSVGRFVARRYQSGGQREQLAALIGASLPADAGNEEYARAAAQYLCAGSSPESAGNMDRFLQKMDEFDLDEYIRVIHFDEMKAPTSPIQLPTARFYTGLPELMDAQLDFLKATVLSRSASPVTMYSDLPMTEMSKDSQFPKKWMFGMAMMLKRGLRLNMIHNVDRPFHEMMLGLESFIPMYMTGQIAPYYLSGMQTSAFRHMLWVSGAAALQGDCIAGHIGDGRMYLTNRKSDVAHYQKQAGQLLKRACPLMEIYGPDRKEAFERFLQADSSEIGPRRSLLASLPIYTLGDNLAKRILCRCGISEQAAIVDYVHAEHQRLQRILEHSTVSDVLPAISEEEFSRYPMGLSLAGMFYPGDIRLTYPEYLEYLNQCDAFAAAHPGYGCRRDKDAPFRNIQITILEGSRVIVTKNKSPAIHFVIRHPKMCAAIEHMVLPVIEPLAEERREEP